MGLSHDVNRLQYQGIVKAILYMRYAGMSRLLDRGDDRRHSSTRCTGRRATTLMIPPGLLRSKRMRGLGVNILFLGPAACK